MSRSSGAGGGSGRHVQHRLQSPGRRARLQHGGVGDLRRALRDGGRRNGPKRGQHDSTKKQFRAHRHLLFKSRHLEEDSGSLQGYCERMLVEIVSRSRRSINRKSTFSGIKRASTEFAPHGEERVLRAPLRCPARVSNRSARMAAGNVPDGSSTRLRPRHGAVEGAPHHEGVGGESGRTRQEVSGLSLTPRPAASRHGAATA